MANELLRRITGYAARIVSGLRIVFLLLAALGLGFALGRAIPRDNSWTLANLRALDPADQSQPASDLTALFTRRSGGDCELRVDFVDLADPPVYDLNLRVGARQVRLRPGSPAPAGVQVQADAVTDSLTVRFRQCSPRADDPVWVRSASDALGPVGFDGPAPSVRAALSLVFYDTFTPAATPAQALRRWDGAHTGPRGERHGLHELLNAAQQYHIPLTLLDLEAPATLSAIDFLGGTRQVREMQDENLLELPAVISAEPAGISLGLSRATATGFGLHPGDRVYDALHPPAGLSSILSADPDDQGLPLDARRKLINSNFPPGQAIVMGGDFEKTTWGTPDYLQPALAWLAARPYIRYAPAGFMESAPLAPAVPEGAIGRTAFDAQAVLLAADPALAADYRAVPGRLRAASAWARHPVSTADCAQVCILSNERFYAVIDPLGARLVWLFEGENQLIGPTAQFFIGFSDRSEWQLSKGEGADPQQVMGAFGDAGDAFRPYKVETPDARTIRLVGPDGRRTKTYQMDEDGLRVALSGAVDTLIPLVVRPGERFQAGWAPGYTFERQDQRVGWGPAGGPRVWISVAAPAVLTASSAMDARPLLNFPEDPDREYPASIYYPFPMAILSLSSPTDALVTIESTSK